VTAWRTGPNNAITDVPGIRVGHDTDRRGITGCTVILCETAHAAAVDTRGGAPGTRETDVLGLANLVRTCHAVVFTGGSAFGLAAADGVMRFLAERGAGFATVHRPVPIVTAAVLYDLSLGDAMAAPGAEAGYRAAKRARRGAVAEGSVGAGTGATVAKLLGPEHIVKGGVGTASLLGPGGLVVGALVAVNAVGSVSNPETGELVAGPRNPAGGFVPLPEALERRAAALDVTPGENTTLICVATNAALEPHQVQRLCTQAHDGFARAVSPAHTIGDGDIAFALSMGGLEPGPQTALDAGVLAARAVEMAILNAVTAAKGVKAVPSASEWLAQSQS